MLGALLALPVAAVISLLMNQFVICKSGLGTWRWGSKERKCQRAGHAARASRDPDSPHATRSNKYANAGVAYETPLRRSWR